MKKISLFFLILYVSLSTFASEEIYNVTTEIQKDVLSITISGKIDDSLDHIAFSLLTHERARNDFPRITLAGASALAEEGTNTYLLKDLNSDIDMLIYECGESLFDIEYYFMINPYGKYSLENATEEEVENSFKTSNEIAKIIAFNNLRARNLLLLIQKSNKDEKKMDNYKIIDVPLDPDDCDAAIRKLKAFDLIP